MKGKQKKADKMEYGYINQKKRQLLLQMCSVLLMGVCVFLLGLLLNKWEWTNIFTVGAILFVLPAARYLTVLILMLPYHSPSRQEYESLAAMAKGHGLLLSDLVFTSTERAMHLDYMVLAGGQAYCFVRLAASLKQTGKGGQTGDEGLKKLEAQKKAAERYLNQHFVAEKLPVRAKVWSDYAAFQKAVRSHTLREGEWEELEKVRDTMRYFMV